MRGKKNVVNDQGQKQSTVNQRKHHFNSTNTLLLPTASTQKNS
jgi:hypothetical protein